MILVRVPAPLLGDGFSLVVLACNYGHLKGGGGAEGRGGEERGNKVYLGSKKRPNYRYTQLIHQWEIEIFS